MRKTRQITELFKGQFVSNFSYESLKVNMDLENV